MNTARTGTWRPYAVITLLLAVISLPLAYRLDPDFGWHLYLGSETHPNGIVTGLPGYEQFTGLSLPDHEWLSHLILYPFYYWFGYGFFVLITFAVILCACFLGIRQSMRRGAGQTAAALSLGTFLASLTLTYGVRLQMLLLVAAALLVEIAETAPSASKRRLTYFLLFAVGTNLHGGFLLLAPIPLLLELGIARRQGGRWQISYLFTAFLILLGISLTPFGVDFWHMAVDYAGSSYYKAHIDEWANLTRYPWLLAPLTLLVPALGLRQDWTKRLLLVGYLLLGLLHVRFFPLFALLAAPSLAEVIQLAGRRLDEWRPQIRLAGGGLIFLWVLIGIQTIEPASIRWPLDPAAAPGYPQAALEHMAINYEDRCNGHLFNQFEWGGYLLGFYPSEHLFLGSKEPRVFIDGRGPQLRVDGNISLLERYTGISRFEGMSPEQALEWLDRYGINCVLLKPELTKKPGLLERLTTAFSKNPAVEEGTQPMPLLQRLATEPAWEQAFADETAVLYVRTYELSHSDPAVRLP